MNEEKGRYKLESYNEAFCEIHDTESDEWYKRRDLITDLLNQQDKQIKELELLLNANKKIETNSIKGFEKLKQEIQQLKQSQKQLAISELEKVKKSVLEIDKIEIKVLENGYSTLYCDRPEVITIINNQIKQLEVQNEV